MNGFIEWLDANWHIVCYFIGYALGYWRGRVYGRRK